MDINRMRKMIFPNKEEAREKSLPVTCCLQGGMGNQMFQYAMAKSVANKLNTGLLLNDVRFSYCNMRQYSLGLWKGVTEEITTKEHNRVLEVGLPYNRDVLDRIVPGSSIVGYWQTEKYFSNIKNELQEIFIPKQELTIRGKDCLEKITQSGNRSVFLTVRRTDYVNSSFHNVLSKDYYDRALSIITQDIKDPVIFIFSDEPEWCKQNMNLGYETHIGGNYDMTTKQHLGREDEELFLMMNCKHAILANSSYSWWGAWLNKNPGIRIAPVKWFENENANPIDIIPESWIKI